ncbi:MAG: ABC transporter ATP-binding protein [Candidatus Coatesbacteria bacterium]|nr:MAG: ABC transporter ATP-binding protein [Candidatus Coatesbacteria bacterium]
MPEPLLKIEGLAFSFDRTPVLSGVNLEIHAGENCLLWGLNGSGKTTLGKIIAGLLRPGAGRVNINGPEDGAPAGMVLAEPDRMLLGDTVLEDVYIGPENLGFDRTEVERRAFQALDYVNLLDYRDRPTAELSTGERKRLAVAGALAMGVELLILDEPFAFMDDAQAERLFTVLHGITESGRSTLVLSGHLLWPKRYDRLFVLCDGAVKSGQPDEMARYIDDLTAVCSDPPETVEGG